MKKRMAASFAVWLVAVAFVASIAWLAIDTAGQQVTSAQAAAPLPTDDQATDTPQAESATAKTPKHEESGHPPQPTQTLVPTITTGPPSAPAVPQSTTFSSEVGRVRVTCTGATISFNGGYAQPAPGWSLRVVSRQTGRIVVNFFSSGHPGVAVIADCVEGAPHFYTHKITSHSPPRDPDPSGSPGHG